MTDLEYMNIAENTLKIIEQTIDEINDQTEADIDNQRSGAMMTLTFQNKSQIVINLQKPLQEIWLAARCGGYHYRFDETDYQWKNTKGGLSFFEQLSDCASKQANLSLLFKNI